MGTFDAGKEGGCRHPTGKAPVFSCWLLGINDFHHFNKTGRPKTPNLQAKKKSEILLWRTESPAITGDNREAISPTARIRASGVE